MLLRRVVEHVRTQDWTAVALDFVIVALVVAETLSGPQQELGNDILNRIDGDREGWK